MKVTNSLAVTTAASNFGFASTVISGTLTMDLENCTGIDDGGGTCFASGSTSLKATNCVAFGGATGFSGTFIGGSTNNASDDSTEPGSNPITTDIVSGDFTNTAGEDYSVSGITSTLYNAGADLGLQQDIKGQWRATDVGAYEFEEFFNYEGLDFIGNVYDANNNLVPGLIIYATDSNPTLSTGFSVSFINTVTLQVTVLDTEGFPVQGARVRVEGTGIESPIVHTDGELILQGETDASGIVSTSAYNYAGDAEVRVKVRLLGFKNFRTQDTITTTGLFVNVRFVSDNIVDLP